jgi:hypothetical protein
VTAANAARKQRAHAGQIEQHLAARLVQARAHQTFWSRLAALFGKGGAQAADPRARRRHQALSGAHAWHDELARARQQAAWHRRAVAVRGGR